MTGLVRAIHPELGPGQYEKSGLDFGKVEPGYQVIE